MSETTQTQENLDAQKDLSAYDATVRTAAAAASKKVDETLMNPNFFEELKKHGVDNDLYDWVSEEMGPELADGQMVGHRDPHHAHRREWLDQNHIERMIAERSPGRLIKNKPYLLAVAQDCAGPDDPEYRAPLTDPKRRVLRSGQDVATNRKTMAVDGYGVEAVTTATHETRSVNNTDEQKSRSERASRRIFG